MKEVARQLRAIVKKVLPRLSQMGHDDLDFKPAEDEWSKKEILGHLIDSAANNHQRFVRAVIGVATEFPAYDQTRWVSIQHYNQRPWDALVAFWSAYNHHLAHLIESIPAEAGSAPCNIGKKKPVPLDFVINDYLRHLRLHLNDILGESI